jgi:hypothetical protein
MRIIMLLSLIATTFFSCSVKEVPTSIQGRWLNYRTELEDGQRNDDNGHPFAIGIEDKEFKKDTLIDRSEIRVKEMGQGYEDAKISYFNYSLNGDTLIINGEKSDIIEKLEKDILILRSLSEKNTHNNKKWRYYYKRIE